MLSVSKKRKTNPNVSLPNVPAIKTNYVVSLPQDITREIAAFNNQQPIIDSLIKYVDILIKY